MSVFLAVLIPTDAHTDTQPYKLSPTVIQNPLNTGADPLKRDTG